MHQTFLWLPLDGLLEERDKTLAIARELDHQEGDFGFKVNKDWVLKVGTDSMRPAPLGNRPFFVDIKAWNGWRTMARMFSDFHHANVTVTNAYAIAGPELKRAIETFRSGVASNMRIYGVTLLSHYGEEYCLRHFKRTRSEETRFLAGEAVSAGADGVILSGDLREEASHLGTIRALTGIRPEGVRHDGVHEKPVPPERIAGLKRVEAVGGSFIMNAEDPVSVLRGTLRALTA